MQPAHAVLQDLFCALLDRAHAGQSKHQGPRPEVGREHAPQRSPSQNTIDHFQGSLQCNVQGSLQHERDIAAALASADQAAVDDLDAGAAEAGIRRPVTQSHGLDGTGTTDGSPDLLHDEAAEVERYHVAEATTNLAAVLINHVLSQVRTPALGHTFMTQSCDCFVARTC